MTLRAPQLDFDPCDELAAGASATAFLWSAWYDHQRYRLARIAESHSIKQACADLRSTGTTLHR